jgi:hypothetical protein
VLGHEFSHMMSSDTIIPIVYEMLFFFVVVLSPEISTAAFSILKMMKSVSISDNDGPFPN